MMMGITALLNLITRSRECDSIQRIIKGLTSLSSPSFWSLGLPSRTDGQVERGASKLIPLSVSRKRVKAVFTTYHKSNYWGSVETLSGSGSTQEQTAHIRAVIPLILKQYRIASLLDLPCGDHFWMNKVDLGKTKYLGADIVKEIIHANNKRNSSKQKSFIELDIINDALPTVDLILCRDCFVHLPINEIRRAISNIIRSRSTYLLTTIFTGREDNKDIKIGDWRPINLLAKPFNLPKPLEIINERCTEGVDNEYADKSLALWRVTDLK